LKNFQKNQGAKKPQDTQNSKNSGKEKEPYAEKMCFFAYSSLHFMCYFVDFDFFDFMKF
jgi:hypothetical protein